VISKLAHSLHDSDRLEANDRLVERDDDDAGSGGVAE
jgi:hypothetical protein